jgi:class 3 adenylate cyclase
VVGGHRPAADAVSTDRRGAATPQRSATRGFLFADLRGYSTYTDQHGDEAARDLIRRFRALTRTEIEAHAGAEIRTEGDSFYVVFDSVADAVGAGLAIIAAAESASMEPDAPRIRVGVGIHAGEARDGAEGIVSSAVNIAARVCAAARPGELLVTDTVRSLTRTILPVHFEPRGRRRLKGIAEPIALFRVSGSTSTATARRKPWAAIGGAFVAGVAVIITVALTTGDRQGAGGASPNPGSAAAEASQAEETHDLGRFTDPGEFPNAVETDLLGHLLQQVADSCARAEPDDVPVFRMQEGDDGVRRPYALRVRAGVTCLTDGTRVFYWQGADSGSILSSAYALFFDAAARLSIHEGDCATASGVRAAWDAGLHSGQVLCYVNADGDAVIEWTFDDANIYAVARRRDAETSDLYDWWADVGRRLRR